MEITYGSIKSLILEEIMENSTINLKFQVEGEVYDSVAYVKNDHKDTGQRIKNMARSSIIGRMRTMLSSLVYKVTGGGLVGSIATMATNETVSKNVSTTGFSSEAKEAAIVEAFKKIAFNLYFDENEKKWKVARKFSEFEKRHKAKPLAKAYDKKTLARMLIEMSKADGQLEADEKEFLEGFLSAETGTLAELMRRPPLSAVECEEISSKDAKEIIFMTVAAMAIADHDFEAPEREKLKSFGDMMGLSDILQKDLLKLAHNYTIELVIRDGDEMTREQLYAFADKIGMDRSDAERAQVQFSKRVN